MPTNFQTYVGDVRAYANGNPVRFKVSSAQARDLVSGEMVSWDAGNLGIKRMVRTQPFAGITKETDMGVGHLGILPAPPTDSFLGYVSDADTLRCYTSGIHELMGQDGEVYTHGAIVYMFATNTQSVTLAQGAGGVPVGKAHLPNVPSQKSGAVRVPILIDGYTKPL